MKATTITNSQVRGSLTNLSPADAGTTLIREILRNGVPSSTTSQMNPQGNRLPGLNDGLIPNR